MPLDNQSTDGSGVIFCDFDKTLAEHDSSQAYDHQHLGEPIPDMVDRVKQALAKGKRVVIFTARVNPGNSYEEQAAATDSYLFIADWCIQVFGKHLPITFAKSRDAEEIWDDRAKEVIPNMGVFVNEMQDAEMAQ
jgi:hydroxymethylpyrimidine pyrophosphatase-like HAD family hydrolase